MHSLWILVKWLALYALGIALGRRVPALPFYALATAGFLAGLLLRKFGYYPGKPEPLWLDGSSFGIALLTCALALLDRAPLPIGLLAVLAPHIVYNLIKCLQGVL